MWNFNSIKRKDVHKIPVENIFTVDILARRSFLSGLSDGNGPFLTILIFSGG